MTPLVSRRSRSGLVISLGPRWMWFLSDFDPFLVRSSNILLGIQAYACIVFQFVSYSAMGTCFIIEGAASGVTSYIRHVSSVGKDRVHDLFKRKHCLSRCPVNFSYENTDEISRTLHLMHDVVSFDKILPVGYYDTRIN
jgi:hypothetical protein